MNDELQDVRRTRPAPIQGWAASTEGRAVLDSVLTRTRTELTAGPSRPRRRRVAVIGVTAVMIGAGGLAAVAGGLPFVPEQGEGKGFGMCAGTLSAESDLSEPVVRFDPADPAAACAEGWEEMFGGEGIAEPRTFAACYVRRSDGGRGGPVVYPADAYPTAAEACASIKADPVPVPPPSPSPSP